MNNIHIRSAMKKDNKKNYILHILLPCLVYSSAGGILTGAVIFGFRVMTDWLNKIAVVLYDAVCADLWLLPLFFLALAALAFLLSVILKWAPTEEVFPRRWGFCAALLPSNGFARLSES